jgi:small subunit ribosomal protein S17
MLTKQGTITAANMQDTVTVTVHQLVRHPLYKKSFRKSKKFLADTKGVTDLAVGDLVVIQECRPLSKRKHFKVTDVLKRAPRVSEMIEEATLEKAIHREKVAPASSSLPGEASAKSGASSVSSDSSAS